jgi:hypothetical protein
LWSAVGEKVCARGSAGPKWDEADPEVLAEAVKRGGK